MRTSSALLIPALILAVAASSSAQDWDADMGKVYAQERDKHWEEMLTWTSGMLGQYKEDRQVYALYERRGLAYESTQRWDAMAAEAALLDQAPVGKNKPVLAKVLSDYADRLHRHQKGELAVQVYRLVLDRCPGQSERCAWARVGIGDCYLFHVKDSQPKALAEFLAVERDYPKEDAAVGAALSRICEYGGAMKDPRAAADACGRAIRERRAIFDAPALEHFAVKRGEWLDQAQDWTAAVAAYREAEVSFARTDPTRSEMAWRQAVLTQQHVGTDPAILPLEHALAAHGAAAQNICQESLRRLVDIHFNANRYAEAAQFAHVGLDTGDRDWSLAKMVDCLKALDPTNARLVAFLNREIDGVKSPDGRESADVLGEIGYPPWPEEVAKSFDASLAGLKDDWQSLRRKGISCLYRGRPRDATGYLYRAFLACPNPQETVRLRNDLVEEAYHGVFDTHVGAERWRRFLCPGPEDAAPDADVAEMFKRERPAPDASGDVNEALSTLELCLARPYPVGMNPQDVARDREILLAAYLRIAVEKGREDDLVRFSRLGLQKEHLNGLYDNFVQTAVVACRMRDGNTAGAFKFLEELCDPARTPSLAGQARGPVQTVLNQLRPLRNPVVVQPQTYRRYLPPPPRKTK